MPLARGAPDPPWPPREPGEPRSRERRPWSRATPESVGLLVRLRTSRGLTPRREGSPSVLSPPSGRPCRRARPEVGLSPRGSISRGKAVSTNTNSRPARFSITGTRSSRPITRSRDEVQLTAKSAWMSSARRLSSPTARAPNRWASASARSWRRLATNTVFAPCPNRTRPVSPPFSPVPITSARRSASAPNL